MTLDIIENVVGRSGLLIVLPTCLPRIKSCDCLHVYCTLHHVTNDIWL